MKDEVVRLASPGSGSSELVRTVVASAKAHDPTAEQLDALTARLAAALPAGALATGAAGGAVKAGLAAKVAAETGSPAGASATPATAVKIGLSAKVVVGLATLAVASTAVWSATRSSGARPNAGAQETTTAADADAEAASPTMHHAEAPSPGTIAAPSSVPDADAERVAPIAPAKASSTVARSRDAAPAEAEAAMLARAHEALLRGAPGTALAITDAHGSAYPRGVLAQEREMIAIEALEKRGDHAGARARAMAFRRHYPGSSHLPRLDAMLPP